MLQAGRSSVRVLDKVDFFNLPYSSSRTIALGSTQLLTEMGTRKVPGSKGDQRVWLTTLSPFISQMSENVGASTSHSYKGLPGLYRDIFTKYQLTGFNQELTALVGTRHSRCLKLCQLILIEKHEYLFAWNIHTSRTVQGKLIHKNTQGDIRIEPIQNTCCFHDHICEQRAVKSNIFVRTN
jgi:hypothetical protein